MSVENSLIHEIDVLRRLLGEGYATVEVRFPKTTRKAEDGVRDPQILYLTTVFINELNNVFVSSIMNYISNCR